MRSTFYGFEIAKTGLFASQRAQDVVSHNIANANTPGFTRQQAIMSAISPPTHLSISTAYGKGQIGAGVEVQEVRQLCDQFLDEQFRRENKALGEWETKSEVLSTIEAIFNEPSDSSIRTVFDQFFASLQELSQNPESLTTRALVRQRGVALAETIRHIYTQLSDKRAELNSSVLTRIDEINSYAEQIRDLNAQIYKFELTGDRANDLRDKRNLLLDQLSKIVNITAYEDNRGHFRVDIGGQALVDHIDSFKIVGKVNSEGMADLYWETSDTPVKVSGGILKGLLDMRDGKGDPEATGIPYYLDKLNQFAQKLVEKFNEIHRSGYGLNGKTGINFFSFHPDAVSDSSDPQFNDADKDGYPDTVTPSTEYAKNITVSSDIMKDLNNIAASDVDPSSTGEVGNNKNLLSLISLKYDTSIFSVGSFDDFTKSLISNLGVDSQQAQRMADNQDALTKEVDQRRQAVSGVSIDEEMANMVKFQHSYNASARMITVMDEMLDVIINRLGIVGR